MQHKIFKNSIGLIVTIAFLFLSSSFNKPSPNQKVIKAYYLAYENKDWNMLKSLLADGFTFTSPNDDHIDINTYRERCWPNSVNIKRFDIVKMMVEGDDAFVTYNGQTNDGRVFRNTECFKFKDGKILTNECFFGPGVSYPNNKGKK